MIQIIDRVECDSLHKSVVKPEAFKKVVLVQDAGNPDQLFALVMVDAVRAVLVAQGAMSLNADAGAGVQKLQAFRNQLYKAGVRSQEFRACVAGTYQDHARLETIFDPAWLSTQTPPDLTARFAAWRAGRATW